jgi:hypothetical protein
MERKMKADVLFKSCLLACSVLEGGQALADPIVTTQSPYTVNSIDFSYMNYSRPPASYFNRRPLTDFGRPPPFRGLPPPMPAVDAPGRPPGPALPSTAPGQNGSTLPIETPAQSPVVVALPEPGTFALLGMGFFLLILQRRKGRPAA